MAGNDVLAASALSSSASQGDANAAPSATAQASSSLAASLSSLFSRQQQAPAPAQTQQQIPQQNAGAGPMMGLQGGPMGSASVPSLHSQSLASMTSGGNAVAAVAAQHQQQQQQSQLAQMIARAQISQQQQQQSQHHQQPGGGGGLVGAQQATPTTQPQGLLGSASTGSVASAAGGMGGGGGGGGGGGLGGLGGTTLTHGPPPSETEIMAWLATHPLGMEPLFNLDPSALLQAYHQQQQMLWQLQLQQQQQSMQLHALQRCVWFTLSLSWSFCLSVFSVSPYTISGPRASLQLRIAPGVPPTAADAVAIAIAATSAEHAVARPPEVCLVLLSLSSSLHLSPFSVCPTISIRLHTCRLCPLVSPSLTPPCSRRTPDSSRFCGNCNCSNISRACSCTPSRGVLMSSFPPPSL